LAGPLPLVTALGIAAILTWIIEKYKAKEAVAHPLAFGGYVAWSIVSSLFLTPLALCDGFCGVGTRTNKENEEVALGNTGNERASFRTERKCAGNRKADFSKAVGSAPVCGYRALSRACGHYRVRFRDRLLRCEQQRNCRCKSRLGMPLSGSISCGNT
jgi:hypothetical protein